MPNFVCEERLTFGSWAAFERMVARLARHAGFKDVTLVGGSGDNGADVVGTFKSQRWVFQAKFRSSGSTNAEAGKEAVRASGSYGCDVAVAVANTDFSEDAYDHARSMASSGICLKLWNGSYLHQFFEYLPLWSPERRELRDYQVEAVDEVERRRGAGSRHALVVMATGLGKSLVASQLIANELERNPTQEVLVLAHTTELVKQLEISSWPQLSKQHSTHLWTDGEVPQYEGGVVFATWQSVLSALHKGQSLEGRFGLVVVDEAHHAPSTAFSRLLRSIAPNFLLGLTATPWRGDERSLVELFGEPAYTMDMVDGLQLGYLANVDYRMLSDGIDWTHVSELSKQGLTVGHLNQYLLVPERDLSMVNLISDEIKRIPNARALAFCRSIEHAERVRPLFAANGIRAALMHSELSREQRFRNLSSFRLGQIDLLISIEMLNEGIDVPEVNLIAFMRVTHSRRIFLQQLGRGLRVNDFKSSVLVMDFVADIRRIAAGASINRRAQEGSLRPEVVRYRSGEVVKFDSRDLQGFFDNYLADVADLENFEDGARLKFPGDEMF